MTTLLVAGATGSLGREVAARALARGLRVRALVRNPDRLPASLRGRVELVVGDGRDRAVAAAAVDGAALVFSCAGASVLPGLGHGWRGYGAVDWPINQALIDAAAAARARRFVYVSVHHTPAMARVPYIAAHERVADHLRRAAIGWAVVRPTGFFSAVGTYLELARGGAVPEIGRGDTRSNPIADDDLADVCVEAVLADEPRLEIAAGGPDVITRRQMAELAFAALGRPARFRRIPTWLARAGALALRPLHPRMSQVTSFIAALCAHDVVAPTLGARRLADHFAARVRAEAPAVLGRTG